MEKSFKTNRGIIKMDKNQIIELVKIYSKKIQNIIIFKEIILFGSWAQGSASENSDIDVSRTYKLF